MLSWLDRYWRSATGYVSREIATAVHWAEHAIMGVILTVFGLVSRGWTYLQQGAAAAWTAAGGLAHAVWVKFGYVLAVLIPSLERWVSSLWARLLSLIRSVWTALLRLVAAVDARLTAAFAAAARWVIRSVWAPLAARAAQLWQYLTRWAYVAWWYVTHPAALAQLLLLHLITALERDAWQVARLLGTFTLALLRANLRRVAQLAEDVITAVF